MMSNESTLMKFIDAIVSGDEDAQTFEFKKYTESKTIELLGQSASNSVTECFFTNEKVLMEKLVDGDIEVLDNGTVLVKNKRVAKIIYTGEDETGKDVHMNLVELNGTTTSIKDNDPSELMAIIRRKFLSDEK